MRRFERIALGRREKSSQRMKETQQEMQPQAAHASPPNEIEENKVSLAQISKKAKTNGKWDRHGERNCCCCQNTTI